MDKGLALDAELVLGLADIDLIYLRAGALVAAADRVFPRRRAPASQAQSPRSLKPALYDESASAVVPQRRAGAFSSTVALAKVEAPATSKSSVVPRALPAQDATSRSVIRLVLTLVEFVRELLERQAVRRVRGKTLTPEEVERLGMALMQLKATVHELAERHGLDVTELNMDLGPLGTLR